jgi:hypothetical protein
MEPAAREKTLGSELWLLPGLSIATGVSSACSTPLSSITPFRASTSGCSCTPHWPTQLASVDLGMAKPETWRTTARLCEMNRYVRPRLRCSSFMMLSTCAWTETFSAEVGLSQTRNSGCVASARAMLMRWRWPPLNWCGNFSQSAAARPTLCSSSPTLVRSASCA